jgi:hypothetical protein
MDRAVDAGESVLAELANSLQAKEARVDTSIARDINPHAAPGSPPPAPSNTGPATAPAPSNTGRPIPTVPPNGSPGRTGG